MNIEKTKINQINFDANTSNTQVKSSKSSDFSNELKELKETQKTHKKEEKQKNEEIQNLQKTEEIENTAIDKNSKGIPKAQHTDNLLGIQKNKKTQFAQNTKEKNEIKAVKKSQTDKETEEIEKTEIQTTEKLQMNKDFEESPKARHLDEFPTIKKMQKSEIQIEPLNENLQMNKDFEESPKTRHLDKFSSLKEVQKSEIQTEPQKEKDKTLKKAESKNVESAIKNLNKVIKELNQSEEKEVNRVKKVNSLTDKDSMINKDFSIKENENLPQMQTSMNFDTNGQPFSSFMNKEEDNKSQNSLLGAKAQDLAEEAAILSTMAENIAIANKNTMLKTDKVEVIDETGIKKIDAETRITVETIVKYDSVIMNQADTEVFVELVQNGEIDLNKLSSQEVEKSMQISKTLADMLAKAKENNQPLRIDFDNNISVIIRISREGKIRADFLPSSQVAETYLKENLPLLRQRFDDNNIDYDSLNQKERKDNPRENNRKKGQKNE